MSAGIIADLMMAIHQLKWWQFWQRRKLSKKLGEAQWKVFEEMFNS